jgi:hypothetical protein
LSNEEKTKDYENFEKGMIYMKILKKGGRVVEKRGEGETKSMPHAPVENTKNIRTIVMCLSSSRKCQIFSTQLKCTANGISVQNVNVLPNQWSHF